MTGGTPQTYFLHIAKTAGTSLQSIIADNFPPSARAPISNMQQLAELVRSGHTAELSRYPLLMGHFGYTLISYLPERPITVTLLRDPVSRTISRFKHFLRSERSPKGIGRFYHPDITLEEFIELDWPRRLLTNFQTRNLALDFDLSRSFRDADGVEFVPSHSRLLSQLDTTLSDTELLARAKSRLESFEFVGVAERFTDTVAALCALFGWPMPASLPTLNRSANQDLTADSLEPATARKIAKITELDLELHAYASELFHERYGRDAARG